MKINRQFRRRGFTMVELMGAVVISMIIILLLYKIFDKVQSLFVVSQNRARAMEHGRIAMDMMVKDFQSLSAAGLRDDSGMMTSNIEWPNTLQWDYLSPVRRFYVAGKIDETLMTFQVENLRGPDISGNFTFPHLPDLYEVVDVDSSGTRYTYSLSDNNASFAVSDNDPLRLEVKMQYNDTARQQLYNELSQDLHHHRCRFFTNDGGWRLVDYRFGGRENYKQPPVMNPVDPFDVTPFGALWAYRSRLVPRTALGIELKEHDELVSSDPPLGTLDEPYGYARVLDGVVHFRVRAVSPQDPGRALASPLIDPDTNSTFYTGKHIPSHVEVELAVADGKLVGEIEEGLEQRMEGETTDPVKIYQAKLKYLSENLDRVYFYKQLIRIQREEQ